ncbi:type III secretion system export apparatus subunit SctV [Chelatococcus sp. GCM10030263]|uniref:type III secretion system export apparatus subunit SctV n=1 Tax=Chelatococcus sp. GCM10030263 TaxID=3273387 RepID=UPI003622B539
MRQLQKFLVQTSRRSDLAIALLILTAILMMVIPLPTVVVDALIATNIAGSMLVLFVAFYIGRPSDFSSLPAVILIATLFRLSLAITTTRLILLDGDAGEIINTFGSFVIGGNLAVGLVVFLIIAVAQFVVITKGAERVAEVAARFTLDAMPGKQMAIDNDMRSGNIDQAEARDLRSQLERESQLYGAMDGAMKFVKGDAVAGLIIIVINLVGGLAIGTLQRGMALADAVAVYSLLTIGDGLISQIPALLISVASGTVVTRVAGHGDSDLGASITRELLGFPRALGLAAVIVLGMGLVPGFPFFTFLLLSMALAGAGLLLMRRRAAADQAEAASKDGEAAEPQDGLRPRLRLLLGEGLGARLHMEALHTELAALRRRIADDLGIAVPRILVEAGPNLAADAFLLELEDVPIADGQLADDRLLVDDTPERLAELGIPFEGRPPALGRRLLSVESSAREQLFSTGAVILEPHEALREMLHVPLVRHAGEFVGVQETRALLAAMEPGFADLVAEARKLAPLPVMANVLRSLVEEGVPVRNLRLILEALATSRGGEVEPLVAHVRAHLRRQISFLLADQNGAVPALLLAPEIEAELRRAAQGGQNAPASARDLAGRVAAAVSRQLAGVRGEPRAPALLTAPDIRRALWRLLRRHEVAVPVLSVTEIAPEFKVRTLATVKLNP